MANYGEGTIEIDLVEFWQFVDGYQQIENAEILYGVPRVTKDKTIVVDYLYNTECNPQQERDYKDSKIAKQWDEIKNK